MQAPTKRKLCPHCGVRLCRSAYYLHRQQFYSFETGQWQKKTAAPHQQANECEADTFSVSMDTSAFDDSKNDYSSSDLSSSESDTLGQDTLQVRNHNLIIIIHA